MDARDREPIDDGGPAFPQHGWSKDPETVERMQKVRGLTLIDYFAGQAMAAYGIDGYIDCGKGGHPHSWDGMAQDCYNIAAAMLAERKRRGVE